MALRRRVEARAGDGGAPTAAGLTPGAPSQHRCCPHRLTVHRGRRSCCFSCGAGWSRGVSVSRPFGHLYLSGGGLPHLRSRALDAAVSCQAAMVRRGDRVTGQEARVSGSGQRRKFMLGSLAMAASRCPTERVWLPIGQGTRAQRKLLTMTAAAICACARRVVRIYAMALCCSQPVAR
jgi:hypothetical protein